MVRADTRLGEPISLGMVRVSLKGVVRATSEGDVVPSVNAPTVGEANAALSRAAQVMGADAVLRAASDYRRAALAGGVQVRVEAQAWGNAVRYGSPAGPESPGVESDADTP